MTFISPITVFTIVLLIVTSRSEVNERDHHNVNLNNIENVQPITGLVITRALPYHLPQPYQVTVEQDVPFAVKVPYEVPVDRPYEVHIPKPYTVPVYRPVPYPVHRLVPYPIHVPLKTGESQANQQFQHKPVEIPQSIEFDVATSLTRHVPARSAQPALTQQPAQLPPQPQQPSGPNPSGVPPLQPVPATPEPGQNPFNVHVVDVVRFPLKPTGPMQAVSFHTHRPYDGFNLGSQFPEHQFQQQNQQHQSSAVLIRRPVGYGQDAVQVGAFHQPGTAAELLNGAGQTDLSEEQNHELIANLAEGTVFNLNNRLRRQSAAHLKTSPNTNSTKTSTPAPKLTTKAPLTAKKTLTTSTKTATKKT